MKTATVHKCGKVVAVYDGGIDYHYTGWHFDLRNEVPLFDVSDDGEFLFGGYTRAQLEEMSARPAEFEVPLPEPPPSWLRRAWDRLCLMAGLAPKP